MGLDWLCAVSITIHPPPSTTHQSPANCPHLRLALASTRVLGPSRHLAIQRPLQGNIQSGTHRNVSRHLALITRSSIVIQQTSRGNTPSSADWNHHKLTHYIAPIYCKVTQWYLAPFKRSHGIIQHHLNSNMAPNRALHKVTQCHLAQIARLHSATSHRPRPFRQCQNSSY